jgi:hypothetical protein
MSFLWCADTCLVCVCVCVRACARIPLDYDGGQAHDPGRSLFNGLFTLDTLRWKHGSRVAPSTALASLFFFLSDGTHASTGVSELSFFSSTTIYSLYGSLGWIFGIFVCFFAASVGKRTRVVERYGDEASMVTEGGRYTLFWIVGSDWIGLDTSMDGDGRLCSSAGLRILIKISP